MKLLIEVELTRIIGKPKGKEAVAAAFIEKMPTRGGLEVDNSGYEIISVTHKETK